MQRGGAVDFESIHYLPQASPPLTTVVSRAADDEDAGRGRVYLRYGAGNAQARQFHKLLCFVGGKPEGNGFKLGTGRTDKALSKKEM